MQILMITDARTVFTGAYSEVYTYGQGLGDSQRAFE